MAIAILFLQMQASVEGMVTKPGGEEPLAGARVTLLPATAGKGLPPISATSQDDGSFTIQNVAIKIVTTPLLSRGGESQGAALAGVVLVKKSIV